MYQVLQSRFKDFTKHLRRVECHYDRSAPIGTEDAFLADVDDGAEDPAHIAEEKESRNRLQQTITSLDDESRQLWQLLSEGTNLRQIAVELDLSYDSVKRRRRKLVDDLKRQLHSKPGELS